MTPLVYYRAQCNQHAIIEDVQQLAALAHFERVYAELVAAQEHTRWFARLRKPQLVRGVYLWGGIGIGKTFLMDCFFRSIPFAKKSRMHFHQFMRMLHQALRKHQGEKDPLLVIAKELAQQYQVLCFDELDVSDITDAMLLGRLFKGLFEQGVTLIATSNVKPDDLYKNGLAREQFLPAIESIKENTTIVHIPTTVDYRTQHLKDESVFYIDDEKATTKMETLFILLAKDNAVNSSPIDIDGRLIHVKKRCDDIVWFDFEMICTVPRSQQDYLFIVENYHTVFISHIPLIPAQAKNTICLFINLIDVLYDARTRFIFSAKDSIEKIYSEGYMIMEYARTHSRLLEMQSTDYFRYDTIYRGDEN